MSGAFAMVGPVSSFKPRCVVGILCSDAERRPGHDGDLRHYVDAVVDAGGEPVLMSPNGGRAAAQMAGVDAVLVPGGEDVDPRFYGEPRHAGMKGSRTFPGFDAFEIDCVRRAYADGRPMLGICRGLQVMNVAGGGTLIQDIPTEHPSWIDHRPPGDARQPAHLAFFRPGSRVRKLLGAGRAAVNSAHHQCLGHLSPLLYVTAEAPDGVVEGAQRIGHPDQLGVQFHPELARGFDPRFERISDGLVQDGARWHAARYEVKAA